MSDFHFLHIYTVKQFLTRYLKINLLLYNLSIVGVIFPQTKSVCVRCVRIDVVVFRMCEWHIVFAALNGELSSFPLH